MLNELTSLNTVLRTIKPHVKTANSNLLILEIVLHVTRNSAFVDAEYLRDFCRMYAIKCNANARSNPLEPLC
jgi:hypothetical protein